MKFEELYNLISEGRHFETVERGVDPTPEGAKIYKNSDLKRNKYLRFDLGYSPDIAKIVHDFIHKTNEDNGYYRSGFRVIAYHLDHPLLPARVGYCILTSKEDEAIGIADVFLADLWEYALKTNYETWSSHFKNPFYFYENGWDKGYFRARSSDKLYIWEFDPMDKYSTDKETKDAWRDVIDNL